MSIAIIIMIITFLFITFVNSNCDMVFNTTSLCNEVDISLRLFSVTCSKKLQFLSKFDKIRNGFPLGENENKSHVSKESK